MPSTVCNSVFIVFDSSTVMTPSLPTFFIASAMMLPMVLSLLAEIVPTWAIMSPETGLESFFTSSVATSTAFSMPRFKAIGLAPAATDFTPSRKMAWARMVAVVVPSPATSLVLDATSRTICAPMFSNLSESSISLATVTPSLVMRGAPKLFSITTLRPFGPSVTFSALASVSTPRSKRSRASPEKRMSFAAITTYSLEFLVCGRALGDDAHNVGLLHDEEILALELDLGARPFAEQHAISSLEIHGDQLAVLVAAARPHSDDFALLRFLLSGIGNDDPALRLLLCFDALDDHAIVQRTEFEFRHDDPSLPLLRGVCW